MHKEISKNDNINDYVIQHYLPYGLVELEINLNVF